MQPSEAGDGTDQRQKVRRFSDPSGCTRCFLRAATRAHRRHRQPPGGKSLQIVQCVYGTWNFCTEFGLNLAGGWILTVSGLSFAHAICKSTNLAAGGVAPPKAHPAALLLDCSATHSCLTPLEGPQQAAAAGLRRVVRQQHSPA